MELTENPDNKVFEGFLTQNTNHGSKIFYLLDILERKIGTDSFSDMIKRMFNPVIVGADEGSDKCDEIIENENKKISDRLSKISLVRALIDRFVKEK